MPDLALLIHEVRGGWSGPFVEEHVFGTAEPRRVAAIVSGWCARHLGAPIADGLFFHASVGCVFGVRLNDDRRVVVKVHQPRWTVEFLEAVHTVQAALAASGFPCPAPMVAPQPCGLGLAVADAVLDDPGPSAYHPDLVDESAAGLADLVERCRDLPTDGMHPHPLEPTSRQLFGEPHSPLFDFAGTEDGADWINRLAAAGRQARDADRSRVIGHLDWTLRNVRIGERGLVAVYDLDSLTAVAETTIVGKAALSWATTGEPDDRLSSRPQLEEFVDRYEETRGFRFTPSQRAGIGGAALFLLAYRARCEHALDPASERADTGARALLRSEGAGLLSF